MRRLVEGLHSCTDMDLFAELWDATKEVILESGSAEMVAYVWRVQHLARPATTAAIPRLQEVVLRSKKYKVNPDTAQEKGYCTCPYFHAKLICKHYLALRLTLRIVNILPAATRAPRRPRKRKRALEYQSESESSEAEEEKKE